METKEILQQSQNILILLPTEAQEKDIQTASTIVCGLRGLGKTVRLERKNLSSQKSPIPSNPQDFVVSLKGLAPKISKVQYEKDEEDLRLYFTLQQGPISQKNLSLQIQKQSDLTIIVEDWEEQDNKWKVAILELLGTHEDGGAKLLSKILRKLDYVSALRMYISSLSQEDFRDTRATAKSLVEPMQQLKDAFGSQFSYLFLFETSSNQKTQALLWSHQKDIRARLLRTGSLQEKGNWSLLSSTQGSPQQIQHAIVT